MIPPLIPVITPDDGPEIKSAMVGLLLLHVPPGTASVNIAIWPEQTAAGPDIGEGSGLMFTVK